MNEKMNQIQSTDAFERVKKATEARGEVRKDTLDDESRVKVLSPGMLVFKRFVRNKLAIAGFIILTVMFLFAFVGPFFSPYTETQVFLKEGKKMGVVATCQENREFLPTTVDGKPLPPMFFANFALALSRNQSSFDVDGKVYTIEPLGEYSYIVSSGEVIDKFLAKGSLSIPQGGLYTPEFVAALEQAIADGAPTFEVNGEIYGYQRSKIEMKITKAQPVALMSKKSFFPVDDQGRDVVGSMGFRMAEQKAVVSGTSSFEYDGQTYQWQETEKGLVEVSQNGELFAVSLPWTFRAQNREAYINAHFVKEFMNARREGKDQYEFVNKEGEKRPFEVVRNNSVIQIKTEITSKLHNLYGPPSSTNWLGTDEKAMDMLTRLMYGGRISLMVGFVVILLEIFIGVIVGGISGFFGGWVDLLLMRFIDLFNSIPFWPVLIIFGVMLDQMDVGSTMRVFLLMVALGLMGWTSIARVVRGQILMLREQDFMLATECTGLSIHRRIFRHLVPNVMPLLIVHATMGLGGIIITEATLSFLGLGVRPPLASWGSIINAANNMYVMTNCWWIWLPTGFLIVLTVLGFNFLGDGLRDAFDPRMKR